MLFDAKRNSNRRSRVSLSRRKLTFVEKGERKTNKPFQHTETAFLFSEMVFRKKQEQCSRFLAGINIVVGGSTKKEHPMRKPCHRCPPEGNWVRNFYKPLRIFYTAVQPTEKAIQPTEQPYRKFYPSNKKFHKLLCHTEKPRREPDKTSRRFRRALLPSRRHCGRRPRGRSLSPFTITELQMPATSMK